MIRCKFENGNEASLRHITVVCIVVNTKKQILLVKRAEHLSNANKYTIPGGFLDRDEDIKQGALRELKEESGLVGEKIFLFGINGNPNRPKEDRQNVDFIFVVEEFSGEFVDNDEVSEIRWFDHDALPSDEEFAFDHRESIMRYLQYLQEPFAIPFFK